MAALAAQVPNTTLIHEVQGVEDPRTFVHNGAPYVLATLHLLGEETPQQRIARGRKRLVSRQAECWVAVRGRRLVGCPTGWHLSEHSMLYKVAAAVLHRYTG